MLNKYKFTSLLALLASISLIVSCSSSTSSSGGSGQIPTGIYTGVFNGQTINAVATSDVAQLSISFGTGSTTDANGNVTSSQSITGNMAITGGSRCFAGGSITAGSVNGDQMNLTIADGTGVDITLTGRVTDDTYKGTFGATDSRCGSISGGFEFSRA